MISQTFEIHGMEELKQKLASLGPKAMRFVGTALEKEAQVLKEKATLRCPKDINKGGTGHLRQSHWVQKPVVSGNEVSVTIHAGGGDPAPYAIAVHEHLSQYSPPSWKAAEASGHGINWSVPNTGPKWLENTIHEAVPELAEKIGRRIDSWNWSN